MNNQWMRWMVIGLALGLALTACGGGSAGPEPLDVTLKTDNSFLYSPVTLTTKVSQTINMTLENSGALEHTFLIDELGVTSGTIAAGQTGAFRFTPDQAGTYTFYCNVPGHKEGGMIGTLTVTE